MAHMSPPDLVASPPYQSWIKRLGPSCTHLVCSTGQGQKMTLKRATELQVKLNCLHPHLFPMLHSPSRPGSSAQSLLPCALVPSSTQGSAPGLLLPPNAYKYHLSPLKIRGGDCQEVDLDLKEEEVSAACGNTMDRVR